MGEIRSTLDLVLEKTRGLTMSDAEKRAFHEGEIVQKIRGLLQRYLDGLMSAEHMEKELEALESRDRGTAVGLLRRECAQRLDPLGDNAGLLSLLRQAAGVDTGAVEQLLTEARGGIVKERAVRTEALRARYAAQGISGSAVVPNPDADPEWGSRLSKRRSEVRERAAALLQ